jgi:wyosine [tRNA(Phe)-imidazoG37] synthetase (radical SAM superfamily)
VKKRQVYGPVPSRRFGLSLGVDLVPHKTCCLDCVYCQLGRTTRLTLERKEHYPQNHILADVREVLARGPRPDVITLAGSGEPCLYASLGSLVGALHELTDIPVLLLTNGVLLLDDGVSEDALQADILAPSLDAGEEDTFRRINRPHSSLEYEATFRGVKEACERFKGRIHLEVMLVKGVNDSEASLGAIAGRLASIPADTVDINTPVRPVAERNIHACDAVKLDAARAAFGSRARIVAAYAGREAGSGSAGSLRDDILELLARRPCTVEDIQRSLGVRPDEILEVIEAALRAGVVVERTREGLTFYAGVGT